MKQSHTTNPSPTRRRSVVRQHAISVASFIVLATSLALVGCSDPDDPEQPGETDAANNNEDTSSDEGETHPSLKECLAATSVEECEQAGCYWIESSYDVTFHEYTEAEGCREGGDELLCSPYGGGDDSTGFFWRERDDGVVVTWEYPSVVWPTRESDYWKHCRDDVPACGCNERWAVEGG